MQQKLVKNNWFTGFFAFLPINLSGAKLQWLSIQRRLSSVKTHRIIEINYNPVRHKVTKREKFNTEEGIQKRKKDVTMLNQCLATSKATISSTSLCSVAKRK
jgi:hypothetical protein